ncbi:MAG TPA: DnaB-like helicase N-terminal domain-containing protein, partial [Sedimentisphaerales bacterium]|nr:DnaB-like helicase N-terminal domain-containing protein [Sedimentisphaerales bacterium]
MAGKVRTQAAKPAGSVRESTNGAGAIAPLRTMPESLAAEAAVLGSMIVGPECIGDVVETLERDAFYRIEHRHIYEALISLYE